MFLTIYTLLKPSKHVCKTEKCRVLFKICLFAAVTYGADLFKPFRNKKKCLYKYTVCSHFYTSYHRAVQVKLSVLLACR